MLNLNIGGLILANLFDLIEYDHEISHPWRPEAPPCLDGIKEVYLNFETTGLKWFESDLPISLSLHAGDKSYYLPFAHRGGGNLDEQIVYRWAQKELRGKHIVNINTRFDIHFGRVWGEKLGNGGLNEYQNVY